jgi:hypothetical protein
LNGTAGIRDQVWGQPSTPPSPAAKHPIHAPTPSTPFGTIRASGVAWPSLILDHCLDVAEQFGVNPTVVIYINDSRFVMRLTSMPVFLMNRMGGHRLSRTPGYER